MPASQPIRYVLLSDAPPLQETGTGCRVLARDWLDAMADRTALVVTRRSLFGYDRAELKAHQTMPVRYYFDLRRLRLGSMLLLRRGLEWLLFLCMLPSLARAVRRSGAQRIFALSVAEPAFLFVASMLARATGLPLDLYLVDDYEEFVRQSPQAYLAPVVRFFEPRFLRRADRVFAISPGYVDHLRTKYGQPATWLPVLALEAPPRWQPYRPGQPDVRSIVFVGSVNFLYESSLVDLYRAIGEWNGQDGPFRLRLQLVTRRRPDSFVQRLASLDDLDLVLDADEAAKADHLHNAWAVFLPYVFAEALRVFVTTSFSYKFTDALASGRPILAYGPPYASIPRYFREAGLPLCATDLAGLSRALHDLAVQDGPELHARYQALARCHHSPAALRKILLGE